MLTLSIQDLHMMQNQFYEAYTELFKNSFNQLRRTIKIKLMAIKYCEKFECAKTKSTTLTKQVKDYSPSETFTEGKKKKQLKEESKMDPDFVFNPVSQAEVDCESSLFYSSDTLETDSDADLDNTNSQESIDLDEEDEKKQTHKIFNRIQTNIQNKITEKKENMGKEKQGELNQALN